MHIHNTVAAAALLRFLSQHWSRQLAPAIVLAANCALALGARPLSPLHSRSLPPAAVGRSLRTLALETIRLDSAQREPSRSRSIPRLQSFSASPAAEPPGGATPLAAAAAEATGSPASLGRREHSFLAVGSVAAVEPSAPPDSANQFVVAHAVTLDHPLDDAFQALAAPESAERVVRLSPLTKSFKPVRGDGSTGFHAFDFTEKTWIFDFIPITVKVSARQVADREKLRLDYYSTANDGAVSLHKVRAEGGHPRGC